jgi:glyoxylase-like metal-dependent hydrolase (beta-lactamase superfamily II)
MSWRVQHWARIGVAVVAVVAFLGVGNVPAVDTLDIYFVNVGHATGANATVLVAPSGESAMLDAGLPNQAPRVLEVFKQAGVRQLDYLVNTHFHADHFGGTARLAEQFPIINFVDHGDTVEYGKSDEWWVARRTGAKPGMAKRYDELYATYTKAIEKGHRISVKAGDVVPIKGIEMKVVCAGGKVIAAPLPGAGQPDVYCEGVERRGVDDAEDAQSIGVLVSFGAFRFIYLGDLTWNESLDLFCPRNKVGTVDAYLITHHAQSYDAAMGAYYFGLSAAPKAEVHGLHPRVAILSLGSMGHRLGNSRAMETVHSSPALEDLWQTDLVREGGESKHNAPEQFIANITDEPRPELRYIKLSARADGSFTMANSRTGFTKHYPPRSQP